MVIFVAVDRKIGTRQRRAKFFIISKGRKSETVMAHKNKKLKYLIDTTCQNVPCL